MMSLPVLYFKGVRLTEKKIQYLSSYLTELKSKRDQRAARNVFQNYSFAGMQSVLNYVLLLFLGDGCNSMISITCLYDWLNVGYITCPLRYFLSLYKVTTDKLSSF